MITTEKIDAALDSVLRASGSMLKHYTMVQLIDRMREAMRKIMSESYIQGSIEALSAHDKKMYFADVSSCAEFIQNACHGAAKQAGWWTNIKTDLPILTYRPHLVGEKLIIGEKLMLIVKEVADAMEGHRKNLNDDKLPHRKMIEVKLADAVIRIFDLAGALNLDLGGAIAKKMAFNATRDDHKLENRKAAGGKAY